MNVRFKTRKLKVRECTHDHLTYRPAHLHRASAVHHIDLSECTVSILCTNLCEPTCVKWETDAHAPIRHTLSPTHALQPPSKMFLGMGLFRPQGFRSRMLLFHPYQVLCQQGRVTAPPRTADHTTQ